MNSKDHFTVKEISEILGISKQAIYKRMTKDFQPYIVEVENRKCLKYEVIKYFKSSKQKTKQLTKVEQTTSFKPLEKMIEVLEKENEYKQKYIESLQEQVKEELCQKKELIDKLTELSSQVGNTLQSITQESLADKLIEGKKIMSEQDFGAHLQAEVECIPEKQSLFKRIFRR